MEFFHGMSRDRLNVIFERIQDVRVAVLGDVCLDIYWVADMAKSELSRETPHFPLPVVEERMSPGGGGNVLANLAALNPQKIYAVSVIGTDWRGAELVKLLNGMDIDITHIKTNPDVVTNAYCKPLRAGISKVVYEDPRLDFCNYGPIDAGTEDSIISSLNSLSSEINVLCVSDQLPHGVVTGRIREHIMKLARDGLTVVVDSRDRIGLFKDVILKPNETEGVCAAGLTNAQTVENYAEAAVKLPGESLMTIGSKGSLYSFNGKVTYIPAHEISGEIDTVGAGDTFLSGFSLGIAAGVSRPEAAYFATLCSEVTIKKIGTTGTASKMEVLNRYEEIDRIKQ
jgi:rfaE bifunctional protein kinase chain/domain